MNPSGKMCPGSTFFKQPTPTIVACPKCGKDAEIWSDEAIATCQSCGSDVMRESFQSCVDWCKEAEACLGEEKYKRYLKMKAALAKRDEKKKQQEAKK